MTDVTDTGIAEFTAAAQTLAQELDALIADLQSLAQDQKRKTQ